TGAGKSTLVNLCCRFFEPTSGRVLIDGKDYRERSQLWLHSNIGYVLQTPHLFSGTVKENIRYGRLDATDEEIVAAAKLVNAHDFITHMEHGYDSDVGEGGGQLSTGEKQLISFARAVLANPRIFVLDEATASIDTKTEALIQEAISTLLTGRTSFLIAHRLSTIRKADMILVVRAGKIIERGTHRELMALGGYYADLYNKQFETESAESVFSQ
ncbi:MAG: ATP-binding cassette domain-containing protein, partial [Acutalibacter sp.]